MHVSSEYLTSSVLPSLTRSDGQTSRILLADIIPWIYIDSPALYIACTMSSVPLDQSEAIYCAIEFFSVIEASKLVTIEVESHSQTPDDPSLVHGAENVYPL